MVPLGLNFKISFGTAYFPLEQSICNHPFVYLPYAYIITVLDKKSKFKEKKNGLK